MPNSGNEVCSGILLKSVGEAKIPELRGGYGGDGDVATRFKERSEPFLLRKSFIFVCEYFGAESVDV